jgi:hypothetical protein
LSGVQKVFFVFILFTSLFPADPQCDSAAAFSVEPAALSVVTPSAIAPLVSC